MTDPLGWEYLIGRTLVKFTPNHDGTIMRFYFDTGIKLTATARNEDEERDEPRCVLTRNPQQRPHALSVALNQLAKKKNGGFKINSVGSHEVPRSIIQPGPDGVEHEYLHSPVYHTITLRGTIPYYGTRENKIRRAPDVYTIEVVAQSDTLVDGYPEWDWSLHDVLFRDVDRTIIMEP